MNNGELILLQPQFGASGIDEVNFYFESDRIAMSDNHRMAYWLFARRARGRSVLVHVDTHTDCSHFRDTGRESLAQIDMHGDLDGFVNSRYSYRGTLKPAVSYSNWIPALLAMHPELLQTAYLVCHKELDPVRESYGAKLHERAEDFLWSDGLSGQSVCFSFDVDYYFQWSHDEYIQRPDFPDPLGHFEACLRHINTFPGTLLFIALSPSCYGGWGNVLPFVHVLDHVYGCDLERRLHPRCQLPGTL